MPPWLTALFQGAASLLGLTKDIQEEKNAAPVVQSKEAAQDQATINQVDRDMVKGDPKDLGADIQ